MFFFFKEYQWFTLALTMLNASYVTDATYVNSCWVLLPSAENKKKIVLAALFHQGACEMPAGGLGF